MAICTSCWDLIIRLALPIDGTADLLVLSINLVHVALCTPSSNRPSSILGSCRTYSSFDMALSINLHSISNLWLCAPPPVAGSCDCHFLFIVLLSLYCLATSGIWLSGPLLVTLTTSRLPHIALFSSLHGDMTRPVGRPRHTWEKCVCADLKVLGQDEGSWEASCQIKSAWRKRLWDLTHPWESQRLVRCRRRTKQAIDKHVERYVVPFSGWEDGGSPVPRWWEPPPAPTRVVLDPAASPPPMCDGSGAGFGF